MTVRIASLAAAITLAASLGAASATEIKPVDGGSVSLGSLSGVAYYTAEPKGYRVVVTLARRDAAPAVRFETVLAADQSVTLSTPRELGSEAETVEVSRVGDRVLISQSRLGGLVQEAAASN